MSDYDQEKARLEQEIANVKQIERLKKEVARMKAHLNARYEMQDRFFRIINDRFDDENYEKLWDAISDICCACFVRDEMSEGAMESELEAIDVYDYFPEKNQEEETEANYKKYYGSDSE
jgi:hypothetical protein